jgi:hypothetical protein
MIGTPSGKLLDIAPSDLSQLHPFIRHPGTTDEFDQLTHQYRIVFMIIISIPDCTGQHFLWRHH